MSHLTHRPSSTPETPVGAPGPFRFSLDAMPERERPDAYREFFRRSICGVDIEPVRDVPFEVDLTLRALPGVQMLRGKVYGARGRRTRALTADGIDDFSLIVNMGGPYVVSQGRNELVLADGEATLLSLTEPVSLAHHPPGNVIGLRIPRARLAPLITRMEDSCLRPIPRGTGAIRLLTDYVTMASDEHMTTGRDLQHLVATHIHDLVAVAVGATRDAAEAARGRGVRAARLHAIKQDIAGSLGRTDLSVATLAARYRCTPRFIQRLFEAEGTTFTEYVLAQRLARAHRMLTDPRRDGEKIAAIAYDAGFGDLSYFNRVFRRHYGMAPSDARAQAEQQSRDGGEHR
jgi:AraC-like DNA-binding protein